LRPPAPDDAERLFRECAPRRTGRTRAVGKKAPRALRLPSDLTGPRRTRRSRRGAAPEAEWWRAPPALVRVDIASGAVLAWRIDWL
jgi:hypothetical protein